MVLCIETKKEKTVKASVIKWRQGEMLNACSNQPFPYEVVYNLGDIIR